MQNVSILYTKQMEELIREPSRMKLVFAYPTGDVTYLNEDIVKVVEKKDAHLIAGELPTIDLTVELMNLDRSFDPNDASELHDMIIAGSEDYLFLWIRHS